MCKIKRAILIAAGEGSRMRPITLKTPKPLVKVNGKRIIDTSLEALFKNGIEDVYIVVGYKKEQFIQLYADNPRIHIVENDNYLNGNNITSMYLVREFLPESFVLEADIMIRDPNILNPIIKKSGYMATWKKVEDEWLLNVKNDQIINCKKNAREEGYQLWGISMWNKSDGEKLSELIREKYENKVWNIFWDEIALFYHDNVFDLGIREIEDSALLEIDTFQELVSVDPSYKDYECPC